MDNVGIKVTGIEKEEINNVKNAIIEIMNTRADQETIRLALATFSAIGKVENVTVTNCQVTMQPPQKLNFDFEEENEEVRNGIY